MRRRKYGGGVNIGGSSILVIFVLLCLVTFATLATVSAVASYRLAQRVVASSKAYFAADARAEEILAEVSRTVREAGSAPRAEELYIALTSIETEGNMAVFSITNVTRGGAAIPDRIWVSYYVQIDGTQALHVEIEIIPYIRVTKWETVVTYVSYLYDQTGLGVWTP